MDQEKKSNIKEKRKYINVSRLKQNRSFNKLYFYKTFIIFIKPLNYNLYLNSIIFIKITFLVYLSKLYYLNTFTLNPVFSL